MRSNEMYPMHRYWEGADFLVMNGSVWPLWFLSVSESGEKKLRGLNFYFPEFVQKTGQVFC